MSQPPAPKPPRQSSTNVPPQTVPVQPVANSHQRGQGKKSYTLLFILLGAAALFMIICVVGVAGFIWYFSNNGSSSTPIADSEKRATARSTPTPLPSQVTRSDSRNHQPLKVDSFQEAKTAIMSDDFQLQELGFNWLNENEIPDPESAKIANRAFELIEHSHTRRSIKAIAFEIILKIGESSSSDLVLKAHQSHKIDDAMLKKWLKKHHDPAFAKDLFEYQAKSHRLSIRTEEFFEPFGSDAHATIIKHYNSSEYSHFQLARNLARKLDIPSAEIVQQCIDDLGQPKINQRELLVVLAKQEPIERLKPEVTKQLIKLLLPNEEHNAAEQQNLRRFVEPVLAKWGTEQACQAVAESIEKCSETKSTFQYLRQFKNEYSAKALVYLLKDYRVGEDAFNQLREMKPLAEPLVIEHINDIDSRRRSYCTKLIEHYETGPVKIALQCAADINSKDEEIRKRRRSAFDQLIKLEPQPNAKLFPELQKVYELVTTVPDFKYLEEKIQILVCRWCPVEFKKTLGNLTQNVSTRVYAAVVMRQLVIDPANGRKNLKSSFTNNYRYEVIRELEKADSSYEEFVIPLLTTSEERQVRDVLKILKAIGTKKSIAPINKVARAAERNNNRRVATDAKQAIDEIKKRQNANDDQEENKDQ